MILTVLMEDTACDGGYVCEHGLSLHLSVMGLQVLFDMGQSGAFVHNAAASGIDLSQVDCAILSHGHYDHGGGLPAFLQANDRALVYRHVRAADPHFARRADGSIDPIGLPPALLNGPRFVAVRGDCQIAPGLTLFSSVQGQSLLSQSNRVLLVRRGAADYTEDPFQHEQSLLIELEHRAVLLAGCAHRGIVNIMERAMELHGGPLDAVVGGFHLSNPRTGACEPEQTVRGVGAWLAQWEDTRYYTGHCTGRPAYEQLQPILGDRLQWISAGSRLEL